MKHICEFILMLALLLLGTMAHATEPSPAASNDLVFRAPFTLRLHVDKEHYYEESVERKIPYATSKDVYLFSGESFGLKLGVNGEEISTITYRKEKAGADIELEFKQEVDKDGNPMMMLILKSNLKQVVYMDALMTVPAKKGIYKTSILPLQPGLADYESWPHPIVQLVLSNLRFKEK